MNRRVAVRAIVIYEGQLLCVRLQPYEGALSVSKDEWWCLPGGSLELGESLHDGVVREMMEETGVTPTIGNLLYIQQFTHKDTEHLEFFFHVTNAGDYLHIDLAGTSHGLKEIAEVGFIDPKSKTVLPKFLTTEDLPAKIAANDSPMIFSYPTKTV